MNAVKFIIETERLVCQHWDTWGGADQSYITRMAKQFNIECHHNDVDNEMVFIGTPQNLYFFLGMVCKRYDVELI